MANTITARLQKQLNQGVQKKSKISRDFCVLSTYKYLLESGKISDDGAAANRYNELLIRKGK